MKITSLSIVAQLSAARQGLEKRFGPMEEAESVGSAIRAEEER